MLEHLVEQDGTAAGMVVHVSALAPMLDFLTETIGFRVESIFPADAPRCCTLVGFGTRLHLEPGTPQPQVLRLEGREPARLEGSPIEGPDHLRVEFVGSTPGLVLPPLVSSLCLTHEADAWHVGRAGMHYRDLVPDRQGGAVIASHIRIPGAGHVPDYVHFHEIAFQLIFCRRGSVTVVYEDQGEPFVLTAGDCVTQPPRIRHRVLESSDDLEVIEIGYPAEHVTRADPSTRLPSATVDPSRTWDGQKFVHHRLADVPSQRLEDGVHLIQTEVSAGTLGLADVSQVELASAYWECPRTLDREFVLLVSLDGEGSAHVVDGTARSSEPMDSLLASGSALVVPEHHSAVISATKQLSLLQVRIRTR